MSPDQDGGDIISLDASMHLHLVFVIYILNINVLIIETHSCFERLTIIRVL